MSSEPELREDLQPVLAACEGHKQKGAAAYVCRLLPLTRMYPLQVDVFLQLPSQVDLGAVPAHRPVVHQEEMGMKTVESI